MQEQLMILVDEQDQVIGSMPKMAAHEQGVLHRAISIFLFNNKGEMLLQKRAKEKYHSAGLWTNACCSHPLINETNLEAANRRLLEELGIATTLESAFNFTYKAVLENGLTEHEYDYVFVGLVTNEIPFNSLEVESVQFINLQELAKQINEQPKIFTEWFKIANPLLNNWLTENNYIKNISA